MSDSIIGLGRTTVMAHRNKGSKKNIYGRIELERRDLARFIGKEVKIIVCLEE